MININVDEGYAFDYLSILEIKSINIGTDEAIDTFQKCKDFLCSQISSDIFNKIYNSSEYNECKSANQLTFQAVERARYGDITAKEVDECNMKRYQAKVNLQKKFFNSDIVEVKT